MFPKQANLRRRQESSARPERRRSIHPGKHLNASGLLTVFLLSLGVLALLFAFSGCGQTPEPVEKAETPAAVEQKQPEPQPAEEPAEKKAEPEARTQPPEPQPTAVSEADVDFSDTVWVAGKEGKLVQGLDGGEYEAYAPSVVRETQQALQQLGLYAGAISGVLDEATREAIGEFQKQNQIQVSGVPSPSTRAALFSSAGSPVS